MEFFIKKGATLPILRMRPIENSNLDYNKFMTMLENSAITFSMRNKYTGVYKVANKTGGIVLRKKRVNVSQRDEYYIYYKFLKKDTNTAGEYVGSFNIDFLGDETGNLVVPIQEDLNIVIIDSFVKTTITQV
jgi:hypothetical protein